MQPSMDESNMQNTIMKNRTEQQSTQATIEVLDDEITLLDEDIKALKEEMEAIQLKRNKLVEWRQKLLFTCEGLTTQDLGDALDSADLTIEAERT
jgi:chromosome segregation ATPase